MGTDLLEELRHLADEARVRLHLALVPVGQEEVAQQRRVRERLHDAVHEARVAEVDEAPQTCAVDWGGGGRQVCTKSGIHPPLASRPAPRARPTPTPLLHHPA